jgi:glycosyltransferase involved in cell wall biosynthesis
MATVDVIVPCYNYGRFLRDCVGSALTQTGVAVRVLIIDDCSTDDTEQVGRALEREDARVEFRRHAVNRGNILTYNEGIEWLSGDYGVLLSADDLLTPGSLARAAAAMDAHPEVGFTYSAPIPFSTPEPPPWSEPPGAPGYAVRSGAELLAFACRHGQTDIQAPTVAVRTGLQKRLGGYLPELPHSGDTEMWLRFAAHASVAEIGAPQGYYRLHGHNMHVAYCNDLGILQHKKAFDFHFEQYADRLGDLGPLRRALADAIGAGLVSAADKQLERGNSAECDRYLDLARAICPSVVSGAPYRRLRLKRRMGRFLRSVALPVLRRLRRFARRGAPQPD